MKPEIKSTRFHERTKIAVPLEVIYNETAETAWRERTETEEVTICGGGFTLTRPLEPRRLVHLRMPLPKQFRLFDFGKKEYDVWGLVRYVRLIDAGNNGKICLKVGAALVGSEPPRSFLNDPATLYDLKPVLRNGRLWQLRELPRTTGPYARSAETRRPLRMRLTLQKVDDGGRIIESMPAETQNVSESGMAVTTRVSLQAARYFLVKTADGSSLLAALRGSYRLNDEIARLHLEFISGKWFV